LKLHSNAVSLLLFPPYSKEQIVDIIKERLTDCHVIDETAIQLCARKISSSSGDIRKALDICSKAIEMVQSSDGAIVTINIMSKAFDEVYQAINKDTVMNTMPLHQKLIACAIVLCIREKSNNKEIPLIKVHVHLNE
jgi:Cdc6-like AAA superfamily ATPase